MDEEAKMNLLKAAYALPLGGILIVLLHTVVSAAFGVQFNFDDRYAVFYVVLLVVATVASVVCLALARPPWINYLFYAVLMVYFWFMMAPLVGLVNVN